MKKILLLTLVCVFVLGGLAYAEGNAVLITPETSNEEVKEESIADKELTGNPILDKIIANGEGVEKALVDNIATCGIASYPSGTKSKIVIRTGDWVLSDDYNIEISIEDYQKNTSYVYWDILNEIFPTEAEKAWNNTDTKVIPQTGVMGVADGKQYRIVNYANTISVYINESK
ncbi:hypothetical protein [Anaeromicrobium sediminis]|uniref:Uncharacterized protein n=1 Tax=Anaeromicrobium sediminis TaxID=1478221 RepID=A0A267MIA7_9FIRM|nr:hypothetical protein [Anaeromicrobium sediminis]PAB58605.1 hypothetical protein CCE28_14065 [Anaeromicrobium sediminis]